MNTELLKSKLLEAAFNGSLTHADTSTWEDFALGEIFLMKAGKNVTAADISEEQNEKCPYPCYGGNGLRGYVKDYNTEGIFPIIGRQGALCGNVKYVEGKFFATEHAVVVRNKKEVDSRWAFHALTFLNLNQYATATAQPGLAVSKIEQVRLSLPLLAEQQRIVAALEEGFAYIDAVASAKQNLSDTAELLRNKILQAAFDGSLTNANNNDSAASLLSIIEAERKNKKRYTEGNNYHVRPSISIPNNWCWVKINDVAITELGKTLDKDKNTGDLYNYLCAANIRWCSFNLSTLKQFRLENTEKERYKIRKGDLLISEGGDVGRSAIWDSDDEIFYQNALHRVRFYGGVSQYFFLYLLMFYKQIGLIDRVSGGMTIKHFTQNSMLRLDFPLPPLAEQQRIVAKIDELFTQIDKISN